MIRTEKAYQESLKRLEEDQKVIDAQIAELQKLDIAAEDVDRAMAPIRCFNEQIKEEVKQYERIKKGDCSDFQNLEDLGKLLIAKRIANGLSQRDLAEKLEVSEAQVSRDERNEYYGISIERGAKILSAMGESVSLIDQKPNKDRELVKH